MLQKLGTPTKRDRKQLNIFERKVYRRILGPVCDNKKENWRRLTNKEIYAGVRKRPCPKNGRRKIIQNSIEVDAETKESTRKTEEKLDGMYKEGHKRKKPK